MGGSTTPTPPSASAISRAMQAQGISSGTTRRCIAVPAGSSSWLAKAVRPRCGPPLHTAGGMTSGAGLRLVDKDDARMWMELAGCDEEDFARVGLDVQEG